MKNDTYNICLHIRALEVEIYQLKKTFEESKVKSRIGLIKPYFYKLFYILANSIDVIKEDLIKKLVNNRSDQEKLLLMYNEVCFMESELYNVAGVASVRPSGKTLAPQTHPHCEVCEPSRPTHPSHFFEMVSSGSSTEPYEENGNTSETSLVPEYDSYSYQSNLIHYKQQVRQVGPPYVDVRKSKVKHSYKTKKMPHSKKQVKYVQPGVSITKSPKNKQTKFKPRKRKHFQHFKIQKSYSSNFGVYCKKTSNSRSQMYLVRWTNDNSENKFGGKIKKHAKGKYYVSHLKKIQSLTDKDLNIISESDSSNAKRKKYKDRKMLVKEHNSNQHYIKNTSKYNTNFENGKRKRNNNMLLSEQPPLKNSLSDVRKVPATSSRYFIHHYNTYNSTMEISNRNEKHLPDTNNSRRKQYSGRGHNKRKKANKGTKISTSESSSLNNVSIGTSQYDIESIEQFAPSNSSHFQSEPNLHEIKKKNKKTLMKIDSMVHNQKPGDVKVSDYLVFTSLSPDEKEQPFYKSANHKSTNRNILKLKKERSSKLLAELSFKNQIKNTEVDESTNKTPTNEKMSVKPTQAGNTYKTVNSDQSIFNNSINIVPHEESRSSFSSRKHCKKSSQIHDTNRRQEQKKIITSEIGNGESKFLSIPLKNQDKAKSNTQLSNEKRTKKDTTSLSLPVNDKPDPREYKIGTKCTPKAKPVSVTLKENEDALVYSLQFSKNNRRRADMSSIPSSLSLINILTSNYKPISFTEEFHLSEHKFNGVEMHNECHEHHHKSREIKQKKNSMNDKKVRKSEKDVDFPHLSNSCKNINLLENSQKISNLDTQMDWKIIAEQIKECR